MAKLLYIQSSPRGDAAYSTRAANFFIEEYIQQNPGDEIEVLNLWDKELPRFDGACLEAKYAKLRRIDSTKEQDQAWNAVEDVISHFTSFDKIVFSISMWNFSVPYILKHYIDIIVQPGVTYGRNSEGKLGGFVVGKKVVCICAAGSSYEKGAPLAAGDFLRPYLTWVLGWIGITDLTMIMVAPTTAGDEAADDALESAIKECRSIAAEF